MTHREMEHTLCQVLSSEAASLADLALSVAYDTLAAVVDALAACKARGGRVITTACGTSAMAAKKIAHTLCCIEVPALFLSPSDAVHGGLGAVQGADVVVMVSKGGNTAELTRLIPSIQAKGALLVGVGENSASAIGEAAGLFLKVQVQSEPDPFNMLATASTISAIAVFDAIAITLMQHTGFTREQFGAIHPSGAVGERLLGGKA